MHHHLFLPVCQLRSLLTPDLRAAFITVSTVQTGLSSYSSFEHPCGNFWTQFKQLSHDNFTTIHRKNIFMNVLHQMSFYPRQTDNHCCGDCAVCNTVPSSYLTTHDLGHTLVVWNHCGLCWHLLFEIHTRFIHKYCPSFICDTDSPLYLVLKLGGITCWENIYSC
jgi:hypothetical protein